MTHPTTTYLPAGYTPLVADAETVWGDDYTLRKMSSSLYVRDPQFKAHGWSVILPAVSPTPKWAAGAKFTALLQRLRDSGVTDDKVALIGWNLRFDGDILAQHYGFVPGLYVDVMGMARAVLGPVVSSFSLDSVSKYLGLPGKEKVNALYLTKNKRDLSEKGLSELGAYAKDDVRDTWAIFEQLAPYFPMGEYETLDWTIRMFTQPTLRLDADKLKAAHEEEVMRKQGVFAKLGVTPVELNSNKRLAETLVSLGVDPPMKKSKTTGKMTYAFAAKDFAFVQLTQHETPEVAAIVQARLSTKSSIAETRALSYLKHADIAWPVDLSYSGAVQTHRLSGASGGGGNVQNLGRSSPIRKAIKAPKDHILIVSDLSNIELRICGQMAGERRIVDPLAAGRDLYCEFGSQLFNRTITKKDNPDERTTSKIAVLSCQYGSGGPTFEEMYWAQTGRRLIEGEAADIVRTYRTTFGEVPLLWKHYGNSLQIMMRGGTPDNKMPDVPLEWAPDGVRGPSGLWVKYPDLRYTQATFLDEDTGETYTKNEITFHAVTKMTPSGRKRTYGGHITENLCQFLAREVINDKGSEIRRAGLRTPMQVHDELVVLAHKSEADAALKYVDEVMNKRVRWWPELPVAAETKMHEIYGEAK